MGKLTDFLKGDAGGTSGSDPVSAERAQKRHSRGSSIGQDSTATSRREDVGNAGTGSHNTVAANSLDGAMDGTSRGHHSGTGTGTGTGTNHESVGERVEDAAMGRHHGRSGADADGDGLDDRSTGNQERLIGANGDFGQSHSLGHPQRSDKHDLSHAEQTHAHLAPVTHDAVRHHEIEEVERQREHERHIHHVKHAVVPIHDRQVNDEVHHSHTHAPSTINERHVNSAEDQDTFHSIGARHQNSTHHHDQTREVVDLGERTKVNEIHHQHNVVQPVIEREVHDRHRKHTTIPIHHTTHEAPIIHDSVHHSPISMADFTKRGGQLDSTLTHKQAGESVLAATECERKTDGPAEGLMSKLHLK